MYKGIEKGKIDMLKAVNWPEMMKKMTLKVAGYSSANMIGLSKVLIQQKKRAIGGKIYDKFSNSDLQHLLDIQNKYQQGHKIMLMIDSNMLENITSYSYSDIFNNSHWVVYEGGLNFFDNKNNITTDLDEAVDVSFKIYTWGCNPNNSYNDEKGKRPQKYTLLNPDFKISSNSFKSTFYGYIEAF